MLAHIPAEEPLSQLLQKWKVHGKRCSKQPPLTIAHCLHQPHTPRCWNKPNYFSKINNFYVNKYKKNLQREEPAQKEKNAESRNMYVLLRYPSKRKNAGRKTPDADESTPHSHLDIKRHENKWAMC